MLIGAPRPAILIRLPFAWLRATALAAVSSMVAVPIASADEGMAPSRAFSGPSPAMVASALPAGSGSLRALLANTPPSALPWAGALAHSIKAYESAREAYEQVKQLRLQQDATRTEITAATGSLELLTRQRTELEAQIQKLESERQERLVTLRRELEARLQDELSQARVQIDEELKQEFVRTMTAFETRLGTLIDQHLEQQVEYQQREIDQLSTELQTLSDEMKGRLGRLQQSPELGVSLEQSVGRAVAEKKAEIQVRRQQIQAQREQLISKRRAEYAEKLRQQQAVEHQTRLLYKEASLRQAMAELLHGAQTQEDGALRQAKSAWDDLKPRLMQAAKRQSLLTTRLEALTQQYAAATQRITTEEAARGESLVRLEQSFQKSNIVAQPEAWTWFAQVIQESPPQLATELTVIYHRLNARVQQERQIREQQKMLRERQLAMQVSREMEKRYQVEQERRQQEQQAKAKRADELMVKVRELQAAGRFDEALHILPQLQMLNPAMSSQLALLEQDLLGAKEQSMQQARAGEVEHMFKQAMQAFEQGSYDQAVNLFEQVISKEAQLNTGASP
jgi:hypothetical protein